ncbi:hypothetical protein APHAL10511_003906 [Amanita phalloides]|nr:hypothetical protein APHAL10511_003906 [Amanita phalloides]
MGIFNDDVDPLNVLLLPPPGETTEQKLAREENEADAKRISDRIDEDLKREKAALKKQQMVRILLLGQAESGKSTTLKNLRMKYAHQEWAQERAVWRSVIQLNLIRSILIIVDALRAELDSDRVTLEGPESSNGAGSSPGSSIRLPEAVRAYLLRLGPLRMVETELKTRLGAASDEVRADNIDGGAELYATPFGRPLRPRKEFGVRWNDVLNAASRSGVQRRPSNKARLSDTPDQPTQIIASCKEDMRSLWTNTSVQQVLKKRRMKLEHAAGFFLPDLDRVATPNYEPTDDDILRARLRTVGVQEYRLPVENNGSRDWFFYDVGGARTVRHAWLPFFDNVNAIIFLAPVSAFDEHLAEDVKVNRLEDSLLLWSAICGSKLLERATLILFLNKCDILKQKLKSGIQLSTYLSGYGDRPNEATVFVKYLKKRFNEALQKASPGSRRASYFYPTSVIDMKATASTLVAVRDGILREHLRDAEMVL